MRLMAYLRLIARKIMSFDQAAPLQNWELPEAFATLQRLLEARQGKAGKREYVQVLRLLERFEMDVLHAAIKDALRNLSVKHALKRKEQGYKFNRNHPAYFLQTTFFIIKQVAVGLGAIAISTTFAFHIFLN